MNYDEYDEVEFDKAEYLQNLLDESRLPEYDKRAADEIFYTLSELGMLYDCSFSASDAEIFLKAFILAKTISKEELAKIRM